MAGLLQEEEKCFTRLADGLAVIASEVEERLLARERSGGADAVWRGRDGLRPSLRRFEDLLMPPVGDLLTTVRERTLETVRRQLRAAESTLARSWAGAASRAGTVAKSQAARLETHWYQYAHDGLQAAVLSAREDMMTQAATWHMRQEPVPNLVRRWCQLDPLYLTGSHTRGVVWLVRGSMNARARNAGVALANGLTLAGIESWNVVTGAESA
jgi:hypothetical protein